ncbi:hypothetical protein KC953_02505 [Candidatus Saccharibacteria bacterium]|nr:hypothetical protein [Candidatus Saccharibacteria bacterium]
MSGVSGSVVDTKADVLQIADFNICVGDTVKFTTSHNGRTDTYSIVLGSVEHRKLFKVVAGDNLYYTILPAVEVWGNTTKLDSVVGVVYHEDSSSLILVNYMQLDQGICRTQGQHKLHKVIDLDVASE